MPRPMPILLPICLLIFLPIGLVISDSSSAEGLLALMDPPAVDNLPQWPLLGESEMDGLLIGEKKEGGGGGQGQKKKKEEEDGEEEEGSGEEEADSGAIQALLDAAVSNVVLEESGSGREGGGGGDGNETITSEFDGNNSSSTIPPSANAEIQENNEEKKKTDHCQPKLDLVFLLDTSGSIEQLYQEHVRWAVSLVESLPLEQDTVRVAAVQYAGFPLTEFALGTYPTGEDIRQHLERVQLKTGVTRTGYALRKAESELFRPDRGARKDATKVIVLFTDGLSIDDPLKPAQQLRELKHVKIFVVSVGTDSFRPELNRIAGHEENMFGPEELPRLRDALLTEAERARACSRIGDDAFNGGRGNGLGGGGGGGGGGLLNDQDQPEMSESAVREEDPIVEIKEADELQQNVGGRRGEEEEEEEEEARKKTNGTLALEKGGGKKEEDEENGREKHDEKNGNININITEGIEIQGVDDGGGGKQPNGRKENTTKTEGRNEDEDINIEGRGAKDEEKVEEHNDIEEDGHTDADKEGEEDNKKKRDGQRDVRDEKEGQKEAVTQEDAAEHVGRAMASNDDVELGKDAEEDIGNPADMLGIDEEETAAAEEPSTTTTTIPSTTIKPDEKEEEEEEEEEGRKKAKVKEEEGEEGEKDEWGLRQGVQQDIDRKVAAEGNGNKVPKAEQNDDDEQLGIPEIQKKIIGSSSSNSQSTVASSSFSPLFASVAATEAGASASEELDVFEPIDGLPLPPSPKLATISSSPSSHSPAAFPRSFPVRVELPAAFSRRPLGPRPSLGSPSQILSSLAKGRLQPSELKQEFPGANISKGLMRTIGGKTMRIVTAAIATSTSRTPTRTTSSSNRFRISRTRSTTAPKDAHTTISNIKSRNNGITRFGPTTTTTLPKKPSTTIELGRIGSKRAKAEEEKKLLIKATAEIPTPRITTVRTTTTTATRSSPPSPSSTTTTIPLTPTRRPSPKQFRFQSCPPVDLLFLVDSSGSVRSVYEAQKEWLEKVLEGIPLGEEQNAPAAAGAANGQQPNGHRVALIQFAGVDLQKTEWEWDKFRQSAQMMDAFHQIRHLTGTTYIGQAFQAALRLLEERRRHVPTLVVLLSDGFSQDDALQLAVQLRQMSNLQFFALSIGQLSNTEYLHRLVDHPSRVHIGQLAGEQLRVQLLRRIQCS